MLADHLLESADPAEVVRGELIALQFHRRSSTADAAALAREAALLKQHGKAWLGPLAPVVGWGKGYNATRFERGFVSLADVNLSAGKKIRLVLDEPSWATVEELTGYYDFELLEKAPLAGLRRVERSLDADQLRRLAHRASPLPLVEVDLDWPIDPALLRRALPHVQVVSVYAEPLTAEGVGRMLEELDGAPMRRLVVNRRYSPRVSQEERAEFDALVREVASLPVTLPELALRPPFSPPRPPPVELRPIDGRYQPLESAK